MQHAPIIHARIWVELMHHDLRKKAQQLQFGLQHGHLIRGM
jgi:hypothetical protein